MFEYTKTKTLHLQGYLYCEKKKIIIEHLYCEQKRKKKQKTKLEKGKSEKKLKIVLTTKLLF